MKWIVNFCRISCYSLTRVLCFGSAVHMAGFLQGGFKVTTYFLFSIQREGHAPWPESWPYLLNTAAEPPACGYGGVHTHGAESLGGPGLWPRSGGNNQRSVFREGRTQPAVDVQSRGR